MLSFLALCFVTSVAFNYLASRAKVTSFAWSRYPAWLDALATCAACAGFWFGGATAVAFGRLLHVGIFGLPQPYHLWALLDFVVGGFAGIIWSPIGMWAFLRALHSAELAIGDAEDDELDPLEDMVVAFAEREGRDVATTTILKHLKIEYPTIDDARRVGDILKRHGWLPLPLQRGAVRRVWHKEAAK